MFLLWCLLLLLISISSANAQRLGDIINDNDNTNAVSPKNVINASQVRTSTTTAAVDNTTMRTTSTDANTELDPNTLLQQLQRLQRPIVGSCGDDRISGTDQTDVIIGFSGSDTISSLNGSKQRRG